MSNLAVKIENLGKLYRIGQTASYKTLRDSIVGVISSPFRSHTTSGGSKQENTFWALRGVSFEVEQGEAVGIIGRNGSGKSTLLKILSRITSPTEGLIKIWGRVGSLLEVGTGFHPELTGRENIYLNGAVLGMKKAEIARKFDEIVAFSEVEKFLDTPVKHYSSGMYVRLAFAVAAHLEPDILIVDEVLAVGDTAFQKKCLGKMDEVSKGGRTVLFVSHNLAAVEGLCKTVVILDSGRLTYGGNTQGGLEKYLYSFTSIDKKIIDRADREGSGAVRTIGIKIFDSQGNETNNIQMGQKFSVQIQTVGKLTKAIIGILIGNASRKQIIRGYTWEQLTEDIDLTGSDTILCHFDNFPLMHGSYGIHVWIGQVGGLADYVENAAELTIFPSDVFKTARIPDQAGGIAFVTAKWEINGKYYK